MIDKKIKAIIFDVFGVLTIPEYTKSVIKYIPKELAISLESFHINLEPEDLLLNEGKIDEETALKNISRKLGIDKKRTKEIWTEMLRKINKENSEVVSLVKKLRKNYQVGILSNQTPISYQVIEELNIYQFFDPIILSYRVKTRKPEIKIYKIALEKLKLKPQECLFIDNSGENLTPAEELGMKTIHFKNVKQLKRALISEGLVLK